MDFSKLNKSQTTEKYFQQHFKEVYDEINLLPPIKFQEKIYWYINDIKDYPKCKNCGNSVKFLSILKGYRDYCCSKCSNSSIQKIGKTKQTCLERYGGNAPACSNIIKEKTKQTCSERYGSVEESYKIRMKKSKQTCLERYGCECVGLIPEAKEKAKQTNLERYGGTGFQSQELNKKAKQTCLERYDNPSYNNWEQSVNTQRKKYGGVGNESLLLKEKFTKTRQRNFIDNHDFLIDYAEDGGWICKCPHRDCSRCKDKTYKTYPNIYYDRKRDDTELCTNLLPIQQSHSANTTIELFVQRILDEIGISYETNKFILDGKQIDIWIPSKRIGIELNGTFHHSTHIKDTKYHINKFIKAKELGIRLITFWHDQISSKPEIVKSMITSKLGYCSNTIYARNCELREISSKEASKFLEQNHIQGSTNTSCRIGLFYNNKLVSVMTFTKNTPLQGSKNDTNWKLTRFCSILNTHVVGAAGKLLKYFIKTHHPTSIVSFSSNDISDGNLYKKLGFETDGKINSSYYYVKGNKRWHRSTFTKSKIVELGWRDKNDNTWTESEVMKEHKYLCIYDSGQIKWELNC